jgi:hypothetical protein
MTVFKKLEMHKLNYISEEKFLLHQIKKQSTKALIGIYQEITG